ncbi:MAG: 50S ribosomal protein L19 [Candidatus Paceibacterota bacterium]
MGHIKISPVNMEERKGLDIKAGDSIRVWQKIEEKGKTRLQAFEGIVLARKHGNEAGGTFTVRRVSGGVGVEKIFPLYSPVIDKIEVLKRAKTRRAKLYHIRTKVAREIRRQMRRSIAVDLRTESETEVVAREQAEAEALRQAQEKQAEEVSEEKTEEPKAEVKEETEEDKKKEA